MPHVRTCLWFADRAEEAVAFYTSLLPDSRVEGTDRPAPDAPPVLVHFTVAGVPYTALQAGEGPKHSPAASIEVELDGQAEADALYDRLLEAGGVEDRCGWITDPWGISWQVIPHGVHEALFGRDPAANERAYEAMMEMKRLDVAAMRAAAEGQGVTAGEEA